MNERTAQVEVLERKSSAPEQPLPVGQGEKWSWPWILRSIPTMLSLLLLGGVGIWGHHTDWKMPRFSELNGKATTPKDWCEEHSVPESICIECKPTLKPQGEDFGWCEQHGVHECPLCHPETAQLSTTSVMPPEVRDHVRQSLRFAKLPANSSACDLYKRRVQFGSKEDFEKSGVKTETAEERPLEQTISASGEVTYDPTLVARLSSRVPGNVWRVEREVGQPVRKGEVLVLVESADVGRAKGDILQALAQAELKEKTMERMKPALSQGVVPERLYQEAEAALREAQIRLLGAQQALVNLGLPVRAEEWKNLPTEEVARRIQFLGLPESIATALDPRVTTSNLVPLTAPFDGVVVDRFVSAGEVVDVAKVLFVVADLSRLWLTLAVRLEDAPRVSLGQTVRFRPDGGDRDSSGIITWMSTAVDEKTRTVRVRVDLPNPSSEAMATSLLASVPQGFLARVPWAGLAYAVEEQPLRANTFGIGRITLRKEDRAIIVPSSAVHWEGCCHVVFVRDRDFAKKDTLKLFHVRNVRPGATIERFGEKYTEIIVGILPGEDVAAGGSSALRTELLKGGMGEGCCGHHH